MHPCETCAGQQKTCCQTTEIILTEGDLVRIAAATGSTDFHQRRRPEIASYLEWDPQDPDWQRATVGPDGKRRMLKKKANGDCHFLGDRGCSLDDETRPLVCRLYPFSYNVHGLQGVDESYCPTQLFRHLGATMVEVLEMSPQRAETWRRMLYAELGVGEENKCVSD